MGIEIKLPGGPILVRIVWIGLCQEGNPVVNFLTQMNFTSQGGMKFL